MLAILCRALRTVGYQVHHFSTVQRVSDVFTVGIAHRTKSASSSLATGATTRPAQCD